MKDWIRLLILVIFSFIISIIGKDTYDSIFPRSAYSCSQSQTPFLHYPQDKAMETIELLSSNQHSEFPQTHTPDTHNSDYPVLRIDPVNPQRFNLYASADSHLYAHIILPYPSQYIDHYIYMLEKILI